MFKVLTRVIVVLLVAGVVLWFFAPHIFNNVANSSISSVDPSVAQAQGLAQYVPADLTSQGKTGNLQVNLNSLQPNTTYAITLDQGQCGAAGKDLGSATTDDNGSFYIELPLASLDINKTWFVDIHQQSASGSSVACGQLQTNQDSSAQAINASQSGPNDFGGAQSLPNDPSQGSTPTTTSPSTPSGLPNTGANPGNGQQYDNNHSPRKY